jgi:hypothetical protein
MRWPRRLLGSPLGRFGDKPPQLLRRRQRGLQLARERRRRGLLRFGPRQLETATRPLSDRNRNIQCLWRSSYIAQEARSIERQPVHAVKQALHARDTAAHRIEVRLLVRPAADVPLRRVPRSEPLSLRLERCSRPTQSRNTNTRQNQAGRAAVLPVWWSSYFAPHAQRQSEWNTAQPHRSHAPSVLRWSSCECLQLHRMNDEPRPGMYAKQLQWQPVTRHRTRFVAVSNHAWLLYLCARAVSNAIR